MLRDLFVPLFTSSFHVGGTSTSSVRETKKTLRSVGNPAEIRMQYLLEASVKRYSYISLDALSRCHLEEREGDCISTARRNLKKSWKVAGICFLV
jgi:hypothetical protein